MEQSNLHWGELMQKFVPEAVLPTGRKDCLNLINAKGKPLRSWYSSGAFGIHNVYFIS